MNTKVELRVTSKDFAQVVLFVTCDDETLCFNTLFEGSEAEAVDYVNHYSKYGMQYDAVYYTLQTE